jgi:hypothetical protein
MKAKRRNSGESEESKVLSDYAPIIIWLALCAYSFGLLAYCIHTGIL